MKKIISLTMIMLMVISGTVFAFADVESVGNNIDTDIAITVVGPAEQYQMTEKSENSSVVTRANGVTVTGYRLNSEYARITFTNTNSTTATGTARCEDALWGGVLISGPFSYTVSSNGTKTYDVWIGGNNSVCINTNNHGNFKII